MKRIPQQEDTAEFKEQAVKRAGEVGRVARVAGESGLVEQTLRNGVKAGKLNPAGARPVTAENGGIPPGCAPRSRV
jgi:transposase